MNPYQNLPMGVTSQDITQSECCAQCGCEIGPSEPHVLLADVPLIDALVCLECSQIESEEGEPEPTRLEMVLVITYGVIGWVVEWVSKPFRK